MDVICSGVGLAAAAQASATAPAIRQGNACRAAETLPDAYFDKMLLRAAV
jgi:hypothetical protein